jgi:hypothetical protein
LWNQGHIGVAFLFHLLACSTDLLLCFFGHRPKKLPETQRALSEQLGSRTHLREDLGPEPFSTLSLDLLDLQISNLR